MQICTSVKVSNNNSTELKAFKYSLLNDLKEKVEVKVFHTGTENY